MIVPSSSSQVRRWASQYGSFNVLTDVPNLKAWYRADTVTTVSGAVSQLTDKTGNGFHYVQGTALKRPTYNASDANMGGRDSISSDGVDDALTIASPGYGTLNACTLYFVTRSIAHTTGRIFGIGNTNIAQSLTASPTSAGDARPSGVYTNPSGSSTTRRVDVSANEPEYFAAKPIIWSVGFDSTAAAASAIRTNGRLAEVSVSNAASAATQAAIVGQATALFARPDGLATYLAMTLSELIVADAFHTNEQMLAVNMYLAGYYGVLS